MGAQNAPDVKAKIESQGLIPSTPTEYRQYLMNESAKWGGLIKRRDLRLE